MPVLDRPQNVAPLVESIRGASTTDPRILFVTSPFDWKEIEAIGQAGTEIATLEAAPEPGDYARKINHGFNATATEFIFQGADDLRFAQGWDEEALSVADRYAVGVVGTADLGNPAVARGRHSTHSLIRRSYVLNPGSSWDGPGIVFHEGYDHQCVDNELVAVAQQRNQWAFAWDSVVEHLHPLWGKAESDPTYTRAMLNGHQDIRLFMERARLNGWTP